MNLEDLYTYDYQKYMNYNIQDVNVTFLIDNKTSILNTAISLSKLYGVNLDKTLGTVSPWNHLIYKECYKNKYGTPEFYGDIEEAESIPDSTFNLSSNSEYDKYADYLGGAVSANPGFFRWVVSFDFASLYPSIIRACNFSFDSHIPYSQAPKEIQEVVSKYYPDNKGIPSTINKLISNVPEIEKNVTPLLQKYKVNISPTGDIFDTSYITFISKLVDDIYNARKADKKKMKEYSSKSQLYKDYIKNRNFDSVNSIHVEDRDKSDTELKKKIDEFNELVVHYNAGQMSKKLALNSFYGAGGNKYFILYKLEVARSITAVGRLLDLYWIDKLEKKLSKYNYRTPITALWDTDSGYICLEPIVDELDKKGVLNKNDYVKTAAYIDKHIIPPISDFNMKNLKHLAYVYNFKRPEVIDLEREIIASSGIVNGMRNYAMNVIDNEGTIYHDGYIKMAGLNLKKTNVPPKIRTALKKGLMIILTSNEDTFTKYYSALKDFYYKLPYNEIAFPKSVTLAKQSEKKIKEARVNYSNYKNNDKSLIKGKNKTLNDFLNYNLNDKGVPIHVRASLIHNKLIKENNLETKYKYIENKNKMKYLYIKPCSTSFNSNVIGYLAENSSVPFIKEFRLDKRIDKNLMFQKTIYASLEKLVKNRGWSIRSGNSRALI